MSEISTRLSQKLYARAKRLIPGGTQLLSKRPEMFAPDRWPAYYQSAKGCEIVDLDGNRFLDMSLMGIGSCLLGYADPTVTEAVQRRVADGAMSTLNAPEEVELAERLTALHPWAEQARFLRTGGEAMAAAVRIARSSTRREVVAICGYHGWHDWYLAANRTTDAASDALGGHLLSGLSPDGVPVQLAGTTAAFAYNDLEALQAIAKQANGRLAAVVMEPMRSTPPQPGFLEGVRELCDRSGALLVIDEITAGFRFANGGLHLKLGLQPDIAVFAKALGNGHPIAAIIGRATAMSAAQDSFISSTYWTEGVGPTAAVATLQRFSQIDVPEHVSAIGLEFQEGLRQLAVAHDVPLKTSGPPALTSIAFNAADAPALATLFTVRMLERGILCGSGFYPSVAHTLEHVETYLSATDATLPEIKQAINRGDAEVRIDGKVKHIGFARLA
ncbi:aminotransferase class III-fold pyridoxal phosphate-dependent enzyme [Lacipirellula parvula]|uniref:Aminotransferase n=1 Tax=Lacipirellula parvula TaxID=2650471 RepID=A0A5K7XB74_9BACT|nr:aminotransferase class III-fold pyridoxal phosphate-dependent enzyme [Lacipirellula parvula]BBO33615.1 aminotransferase [Lacipirellula parvula]